ncbi:MAG: glycosyltransferase family 1 protein [Lachnospiraceae bacterium]|nr:glycosyltransferase family 1 protein [Lachnospiraceae bacterium]
MIRVLQVVSDMNRGGIETMLMNYYRNIDREQLQFDFLINRPTAGAYEEEIRSLGGKFYFSPGLNPFHFQRYQQFMTELFVAHPEYRIIHAQNESMGYYSLYGAKKNNIPVRIAHSHNTRLQKDYKYPIKAYCNAHIKDVCNYEFACSHAAGAFMFRDRNYQVIQNAIDTDRFSFHPEHRNSIRLKHQLEGKFVVGTIGRLTKQKNQSYLLDIFKEILSIIPNACLLIIGTGELLDFLKKKSFTLGIQDHVIFTGSIPNTYAYYSAMDVFVLPSLYEGLPVVGIEAQCAGLPCYVSSTITKELCVTDAIHFLDIHRPPKDWAIQICDAMGYKRRDMKQQIISSGYDIATQAQKLTALYRSLYQTHS